MNQQEEMRIAIAEACGWSAKSIRRFMSKVSKTDSCWNWTGSKGGSGYGQFWDGRRNIQAHWFLLERRPVKGEEACHTCDNKVCVNPAHIFIGTKSDNMRDMISKGRHNSEARARGCRAMLGVRKLNRGVNNHQCKLSESQAMIARACPRSRGAATGLAKHFGVATTVICDIRDGKRWVHLPAPDMSDLQRAEAFCRTLQIGPFKEQPK